MVNEDDKEKNKEQDKQQAEHEDADEMLEGAEAMMKGAEAEIDQPQAEEQQTEEQQAEVQHPAENNARRQNEALGHHHIEGLQRETAVRNRIQAEVFEQFDAQQQADANAALDEKRRSKKLELQRQVDAHRAEERCLEKLEF